MDLPAIALLEFATIAAGIAAGDAMVKRAPVAIIQSGTVQPGHYLVFVAGDVAAVEEAFHAGKAAGAERLRDCLFLPNVHTTVVSAIAGERAEPDSDALGIIETGTVASAIKAADAGVKGADVTLLQIRMADGLGGKGLTLISGLVADVEVAVEIGAAAAQGHLVQQEVISQLHGEMWANVHRHGRFGEHFDWKQA